MNLMSLEFQIAIIESSTSLLEKQDGLKKIKTIKNPILYWCADPFIEKIDGDYYLFAELCNRITLKGKIAYKKLNCKSSKWKTITRTKYHLSFPNLYKIDNKVVMMPESFEDKCVSLYEFNFDTGFFQKKQSILHADFCVDSLFDVQIKHLFSYVNKNGVNSLNIYDYDGDNTILIQSIEDAELKLRPAGKMFYFGDKVVIPTQNCSEIYGGGIIFNQLIDRNGVYEILPFFELTPQIIEKNTQYKKLLGCHTYNFVDDYQVIDILYQKFSFIGLFGKVFRRFFSLLRRKK